MYNEKVFCIGMFKTGTTSIGRAFDILGYKTMHGPWWPKNKMIVDDWYERPEEWKNYYGVIKNKIDGYNAFQDYPWMFLYKEIDGWYPNVKFILSVREYESVAESEIRWWKKNRVPINKIPSKDKFMQRYNDHKNNVLKYFKDKNNILIMNITEGDGWDKICNFLERDIPNTPFPHLNKT
jgi:hypothetical protein